MHRAMVVPGLVDLRSRTCRQSTLEHTGDRPGHEQEEQRPQLTDGSMASYGSGSMVAWDPFSPHLFSFSPPEDP